MMVGIKRKSGVRWADRHSDADVFCMWVAFALTAPPVDGDVILMTSLNDSVHGKAENGAVGDPNRSGHYRNEAGDIRTHPYPDGLLRPGAIIASSASDRIVLAEAWVEDAKLELDRITGGHADRYFLEYHNRHIHAQIRKRYTSWKAA